MEEVKQPRNYATVEDDGLCYSRFSYGPNGLYNKEFYAIGHDTNDDNEQSKCHPYMITGPKGDEYYQLIFTNREQLEDYLNTLRVLADHLWGPKE